jgi:hypothetical protein
MSSIDIPSDILSSESVHTSFSEFEHVGHVMVGLQMQADVEELP